MNKDLKYIWSTQAIRERCQLVYDNCMQNHGAFHIDESRLANVADYVTEVIKENYPDLHMPFHSRWGHFKVGDKDRLGPWEKQFTDPMELLKAKIDLVFVSVLLDAGAGMQWQFKEAEANFSKSEGLALASWYWFLDGGFSSDTDKYKVDAKKLCSLSIEDFNQYFQISSKNPIIGAEGRLQLLHNLGKCLLSLTVAFANENPRPSDLLKLVLKEDQSIDAHDCLVHILNYFSNIWPGGSTFSDQNLGDVWTYKAIGTTSFEQLVPFHKLSQWLTYSLLEPIVEAGYKLLNLEQLTGLAEYRNGGLFYDLEVIQLKEKKLIKEAHKPDSHIIIEWRALTLILLDKLLPLVKKRIGVTDFPLTKLLEGGSWRAGRKIAKEKRQDGGPPLQIDSDATVF